MSLSQFLTILWARRIIILVCTLGTLAAAFLVSQMLPERYQAQSRLLLDVSKPDPFTGEVIATSFAKSYTRTQVELVRDRRVADAAIEQLKLDRDPEMMQFVPGATRQNLAEWITQRTTARIVEGSNVLEIQVEAPSPQLASRLANAVRQAYVETSLALRREGASRTAQWYQQQTAKARAELQLAEKAKTDFERRTGVILEGLTDVDSARLTALAGAPAPVASGGGAAVPVGTTPSAAQLAQVDASIAQASQTLGPNHPEMQELQRRRTALAAAAVQERSAAIAAASANANAAARSANQGASAASQAYQSQRARVIGQRPELEQLRRLQAEVEIRREQYSKTAARAAELGQQAEVPDAGLTMLTAAKAPSAPSFPNRPLILGGALALGFALGILLALLLELMNRRVRTVEDMEFGHVPLLAVISVPRDRRSQPALGHLSRP